MKLHKATSFGLYAALELARQPDRHLSAGDIAAAYGISINHLAKVLRILGRAGLVESVRGAGGGYRFAGNPRRVTLLDVITLFEDLGPGTTARPTPGEKTDVGRALRTVLVEIDDITQATLRSISLATLIAMVARQGGAAKTAPAPAAARANSAPTG